MLVKLTLDKFATSDRAALSGGVFFTEGWTVHLLKAMPGGGITPESLLADVSPGEADFKGYATQVCDPRTFSNKAWQTGAGWVWYFNDLVGFLFDESGSGSDSNSIVGFYLDDSSGLVAVGEFDSPVTIDVDNPSKIFKVKFRVWTNA